MSFVVIAIGAAHAIPPVIGALAAKTKVGVVVGSVVGGLIAVASGNPMFIAADLIGLGVGTWLGFSIVGNEQAS